MIDFRYHLVSIVAVFLALAIGIVLGSTELQGNTIDVLRTSQNSLKNQLDQSNAERGVAQQQVQTYQTFVDKTESKLLADGLTGDRIVLVTEPGAPSSVISGVKQAAGLAGAAALVFFSAMMLLSIYQAEASAGAPSRLARISATLRPRRLATMRGDC